MLKRTTWRTLAAIVILVVTIGLFVNYFATHPGVGHQLSRTSIWTLLLLLGLYLVFIGTLSSINTASLRLCRKDFGRKESLLLTMYSSVINFFGPLQSGPAFRALYLKQKHGVGLRDYTLASFVYYFFYALFSAMLLLSGILKWWLLPLAILVLMLLPLLKKLPRLPKGFERLDWRQWPYMAVASLMQVSLLLVIFYVELVTIQPSATLQQAAIYTGAANLALFVSITPGAIGFRESFLLLAQNLHHISSTTIISANILDRAVYLVLLLGLAVAIFATHANRYLKRGLKE